MEKVGRISVPLALAIFLVFGILSSASAIPITVSYTADNVVHAWYVAGNASSPLAVDTHHDEWRFADQLILDLDHHAWQLIWQTENSDPNPKRIGNPGGFLAEITLPSSFQMNSTLSSSQWEVAFVPQSLATPGDWDSLPWTAATEWGRNDDPTRIWYRVRGCSVPGIDGAAQWIWTEDNFDMAGAPGPGDSVFIRATLHPVPEPSTCVLLLFGMMGILGMMRTRRKP